MSIIELDFEKRAEYIHELLEFPSKLHFTMDFEAEQLSAQYREGSWTVEQIIHHVCDSHLNTYVRFKWALTEDNPTIKVYEQDL